MSGPAIPLEPGALDRELAEARERKRRENATAAAKATRCLPGLEDAAPVEPMKVKPLIGPYTKNLF